MTIANTRMAFPNDCRIQETDWYPTADPIYNARNMRPYLMTAISMLTDLMAVSFALLFTAWIVRSQGNTPAMEWFAGYWRVALLLISAFGIAKLYPPTGINWSQELRLIIMATTLLFGVVTAAVLFVIPQAGLSAWFFVAWITTSTLVGMGRTVLRLLCAYQDWWGLPVIVMGSGPKAKKAVRTLRHQPWLGLRPVCVLDHEYDGESSVRGIPVFRTLSETFHVIGTRNTRYVPVEIPGLPVGLLRQKLLDYSFAKRVLDLSFGLMLGILTLPLILLISLLIKIDSPGPVFYGHQRIGHNGRRFKAWKFRSMMSNADEALEQYLQKHPELRHEWETNHKIKHDPRVTRMGRLLRKTSLDELPQIWNVLMGEMSLVGPRPIVEEEIKRYGDQFDLFLTVKPGITGLWQVSGRNNTTYEQRVDLDIFYVRNWSPWMDLHILIRTVPVVITGYGAY